MVRRTLRWAVGLVTLLAPIAARADDEAAPAPEAAKAADPEEVSVGGTRVNETGGSVHVVKDAQLRRFSYDDPHQVLMGVPGVYVRQEDGMGLRPNIGIRGACPR